MSKSFLLPSGKYVTRFWAGGEFCYQIPTRSSDDWVTLSVPDIAQLAEIVRGEVQENGWEVSGGSIRWEHATQEVFSAGVDDRKAPEAPVLTKGGGAARLAQRIITNPNVVPIDPAEHAPPMGDITQPARSDQWARVNKSGGSVTVDPSAIATCKMCGCEWTLANGPCPRCPHVTTWNVSEPFNAEKIRDRVRRRALPGQTFFDCVECGHVTRGPISERAALEAQHNAHYRTHVTKGGGDAPGPEVLCHCGHQRQQHDLAELSLTIPCFALVGGRVCPCETFKRARVRG